MNSWILEMGTATSSEKRKRASNVWLKYPIWDIPRTSLFAVTDDHSNRPADIRDQLNRIRETFQWPVAWLADVLQVSRGTLYLWLSSDSRQAVQSENLRRISALSNAAQYWRAQAARPITRADSQILLGGQTFFAQLKRELFDKRAMEKLLDSLADARAPHEIRRQKLATSRSRPWSSDLLDFGISSTSTSEDQG